MDIVSSLSRARREGGKLIIETANTILDEVYVERYANELAPGRYAMLAVSDTGYGMNSDTQERIFDPFFTIKESGKGTGLGLATTFGIIKQHRGNVQVYSEQGNGTTFKIYLPQTESPLQTTAPETEDSTSMYGFETVLVAEDEGMVRKLACETLKARGYDVIGVDNPDDCLEIASNKAPIHLLLPFAYNPLDDRRHRGRSHLEKVR